MQALLGEILQETPFATCEVPDAANVMVNALALFTMVNCPANPACMMTPVTSAVGATARFAIPRHVMVPPVASDAAVFEAIKYRPALRLTPPPGYMFPYWSIASTRPFVRSYSVKAVVEPFEAARTPPLFPTVPSGVKPRTWIL